MFSPDQYELIDFGRGRRLELVGGYRLDRPCPAAEGLIQATPRAWAAADARFDRDEGEKGRWHFGGEQFERWNVMCDPMTFELKLTEFGHLGLFPEQADNWEWLQRQVRSASRPLRVLNLFAYTGGSTLAAAAAGAEVTHVDSARNVVGWARRNAEISGLAQSPIRWISEDAVKFVRRELQRGNTYDAVILDPPSYGHGPRGQVWRLTEHLPPLLSMCGKLTAGRRQFMLVTCHTPGFDSVRLKQVLAEALDDADRGRLVAQPLALRSAAGDQLPSGTGVRWEASPEQSR